MRVFLLLFSFLLVALSPKLVAVVGRWVLVLVTVLPCSSSGGGRAGLWARWIMTRGWPSIRKLLFANFDRFFLLKKGLKQPIDIDNLFFLNKIFCKLI